MVTIIPEELKNKVIQELERKIIFLKELNSNLNKDNNPTVIPIFTNTKAQELFERYYSDYIKEIENFLGIPVGIIAFGPERKEIIFRKDYFEDDIAPELDLSSWGKQPGSLEGVYPQVDLGILSHMANKPTKK